MNLMKMMETSQAKVDSMILILFAVFMLGAGLSMLFDAIKDIVKKEGDSE